MASIDSVTIAEATAALREALLLKDHRAVIAVFLAQDGLATELEANLSAAARQLALDPKVLQMRCFEGTATDRSWLRRANRLRDQLLTTQRAIVIITTSAEALRTLRTLGNDLTAAPDIWTEVRELETSDSLEDALLGLRLAMTRQHSELDLTGLLPADAEHRTLALEEVYLKVAAFESKSAAEKPRNPNAWLLLGGPGAGKTTTLRRLAGLYADDDPDTDPLRLRGKTPLLIALADYGADALIRQRPLLYFLEDWLSERGLSAGRYLRQQPEHFLLLLDGLDEVRSRPLRRSVLEEVAALTRAGLGGVVISARSHIVDELRAADLRSITVTYCEPLTDDQIVEFLENFMVLRRRVADTDIAEVSRTLSERIQRDRDLSALSRTPLLLVFLALIHDLEGTLPSQKTALYWRLGELLVDRWVRARSLATHARDQRAIRRGDALRVLGPLAWWCVDRGNPAVSHEELLAELVRIQQRWEPEEIATRQAETLLELLQQDSALLVSRSVVQDGVTSQRWSFVHTSVAEYFAGVQVARAGERRRALLSDPFKPEWSEVLTFALGYLDIEARDEDVTDFVDIILKRSVRSGRYGAHYPLLLISILRGEPRLPSALRKRLYERLFVLCLCQSYGGAATIQVQYVFSTFLLERVAHNDRDVIRSLLNAYFGASPERQPRWDYLIPHNYTLYDDTEDSFVQTWFQSELWARYTFTQIGWWLARLPSLLKEYDLDTAPLLNYLTAAPNNRAHVHAWLYQLGVSPPGRRAELLGVLEADGKAEARFILSIYNHINTMDGEEPDEAPDEAAFSLLHLFEAHA